VVCPGRGPAVRRRFERVADSGYTVVMRRAAGGKSWGVVLALTLCSAPAWAVCAGTTCCIPDGDCACTTDRCSCSAIGDCAMSCTDAGTLICNDNCQATGATAAVDFSCLNNGVCSATLGAGSVATCSSNADCSLVLGDGSRVVCSDLANCVVTCAGRCSVQCVAGLASCSLSCGALPLTNCGGGSSVCGLCDGGTGVDAGPSDAGLSDAGFSDAGFSDAGFSDAGFSDAGFSDAGFSDAGPDSRALAVGCGCHAGGRGGLLAALLVGLALRRRRWS